MLADRERFEFSFSGLKTAVSMYIDQQRPADSRAALADVCASFQAAVIEVLVAKARLARRKFGCAAMTVVGGVSANRGLR
jgi:N6-L-threonylcarbamoyladenine synthase